MSGLGVDWMLVLAGGIVLCVVGAAIAVGLAMETKYGGDQ